MQRPSALGLADELVYFGDLRPPPARGGAIPASGGLFGFSTARATHGGFAAEWSARFSPDPRPVAQVAAEAASSGSTPARCPTG